MNIPKNMDPKTLKATLSSGTAFVTFESKEDALAALKACNVCPLTSSAYLAFPSPLSPSPLHPFSSTLLILFYRNTCWTDSSSQWTFLNQKRKIHQCPILPSLLLRPSLLLLLLLLLRRQEMHERRSVSRTFHSKLHRTKFGLYSSMLSSLLLFYHPFSSFVSFFILFYLVFSLLYSVHILIMIYLDH